MSASADADVDDAPAAIPDALDTSFARFSRVPPQHRNR